MSLRHGWFSQMIADTVRALRNQGNMLEQSTFNWMEGCECCDAKPANIVEYMPGQYMMLCATCEIRYTVPRALQREE